MICELTYSTFSYTSITLPLFIFTCYIQARCVFLYFFVLQMPSLSAATFSLLFGGPRVFCLSHFKKLLEDNITEILNYVLLYASAAGSLSNLRHLVIMSIW